MSFVSFLFVAANLMLWLPMLLLAGAVRSVFPVEIVKQATNRTVEAVYRLAVKVDAWWMSRILGIELDVAGDPDVLANVSIGRNPVVICNHQSWFDIFLLQTLISQRGPMLRFLIKVELLWVPILGWVCLALNFPRLHRKGEGRSRSKDLRSVELASLRLGNEPGGLLIFPEGTRFRRDKRNASGSPYQCLLRPKTGGFAVIRHSMPVDTRVLDISIRYGSGEANCWRCMSGAVDEVRVKVESFQMSDVQDVAEWLEQRWSVKDQWLVSQKNEKKVQGE